VLELAAGAHRRPAALLATLAPSEAHAVACLPAFRLHTIVGPRRRPTPCLPSGPLPPLGELVVQPGRLPGRDRRRLARLAGPAPPLRGQGSNCIDSNFVRVFRVKVQGLFVKIPI
jgi:hypothetical protein